MHILTDGGRLCVGSYLHCMVSDRDLATIGESRVVSVIAEPRVVHQSQVVYVSCKLTTP